MWAQQGYRRRKRRGGSGYGAPSCTPGFVLAERTALDPNSHRPGEAGRMGVGTRPRAQRVLGRLLTNPVTLGTSCDLQALHAAQCLSLVSACFVVCLIQFDSPSSTVDPCSSASPSSPELSPGLTPTGRPRHHQVWGRGQRQACLISEPITRLWPLAQEAAQSAQQHVCICRTCTHTHTKATWVICAGVGCPSHSAFF